MGVNVAIFRRDKKRKESKEINKETLQKKRTSRTVRTTKERKKTTGYENNRKRTGETLPQKD
jgi:hypothetical protein